MDNKLDIQVFFGYISPHGTFKHLFIHLFLAALGPLLRGLFSSCREWGFPWLWDTGFSLQGLLWSSGSRHTGSLFEHRLNSCGTWT